MIYNLEKGVQNMVIVHFLFYTAVCCLSERRMVPCYDKTIMKNFIGIKSNDKYYL